MAPPFQFRPVRCAEFFSGGKGIIAVRLGEHSNLGSIQSRFVRERDRRKVRYYGCRMTNHMQGEIIFSVQESPQDGYHTRTRLFQFHYNRYSRRIENDDQRAVSCRISTPPKNQVSSAFTCSRMRSFWLEASPRRQQRRTRSIL